MVSSCQASSYDLFQVLARVFLIQVLSSTGPASLEAEVFHVRPFVFFLSFFDRISIRRFFSNQADSDGFQVGPFVLDA